MIDGSFDFEAYEERRVAENEAFYKALLSAAESDALGAVVELHRPDRFDLYAECQGCDYGAWAESGIDWPCRTIETIASSLGVDLP